MTSSDSIRLRISTQAHPEVEGKGLHAKTARDVFGGEPSKLSI
jgi:hypothetical protein